MVPFKSPETMVRELLLATALVVVLGGCTKGDKIPSYLLLGQVALSTEPVTQGSASHRITDLWVFVDDQAMGVWEPGMRVPVIGDGRKNIKLIAGVRRNGMRDDRVRYPFYATWSGDADLVLKSHTEITPTFTYFPGLNYWIEAFEQAGYDFVRSPSSDTTMNQVTAPDLVFEGLASGEIYVDANHPRVRMTTSSAIPVTGAAFLEIDHRNDHRFLVGVNYTASGTVVDLPILFVSPTKRPDGGMPWNKVYVDLGSSLNVPATTEKKFYIEVVLADGYSSGRVFLDNIKLVYR